MMKVNHYFKIYTKFYLKILDGEKKHEIRKVNFNGVFNIGEVIQFSEVRESDESYTGDSAFFRITWIDEMNIAGCYRILIMSIERVGYETD